MKLYVGNLPYSTTEDDLRNMFGEVRTVDSASIIIDRMSGRSKGFGFVEMSNDSEAQAAIEKFNGLEINKRKLTVNEARPMEDRPRRTGGFNRDRGFGRS